MVYFVFLTKLLLLGPMIKTSEKIHTAKEHRHVRAQKMNNDTQRGLNVRVDVGSQAIAVPHTDGFSYLENIVVFQGVNYIKFSGVYKKNCMLGRSYLELLH
ncbi:hypothetical protein E2C01_029840 [Portunus trituberculatus]|uniref:Uncharacterized protein n=1 Tax=Portunus trituberculatus TaxID=210409 RepID=A0A5B7EVM8_PORTR|nr:hypothetical protein [Portunus trituberculatus]